MVRTPNADLAARLRTAIILIILFLGLFTFAITSTLGTKIFAIVIFVLICLASHEFCRLPKDQESKILLVRMLLTVIPALVVLIGGVCFDQHLSPQFIFSSLFGSFFLVQAISITWHVMQAPERGHIEDLFLNFSKDQLGGLLLGMGGGAAVALALISPSAALFLVVLVAIADSAAYFAGRAYGETKVAPLVSPKKTVVGTLAGIFCGGVFGVLTSQILPSVFCLSFAAALLVAMSLVVCSQAGDYAKSMVKRRYDIKDFGSLLPGHGGILDRLDGILGAAPLMLLLVVLVCNR